jgi:hypothetical protein
VAKKVVLVIVAGSAVPFNESFSDAALYAMYGGEQAGNGLADVLFGDVSPSGRLPFTVYADLKQVKPMSDYDMTSSPGRTHLYYTEADVAQYGPPQFWFGYGLSYSTFKFSQLTLKLVSGGGGKKCQATATVTVTNTGTTAAREVVQLYLNRPVPLTAGLPMAKWALKGYERSAILAPAASATLNFVLTYVFVARLLEAMPAHGVMEERVRTSSIPIIVAGGGYQWYVLADCPPSSPPLSMMVPHRYHDLSTVQADASRVLTGGVYTVQIGGGHPRDARVHAAPIVSTVKICSSCAC